jgi:hypothetical protein
VREGGRVLRRQVDDEGEKEEAHVDEDADGGSDPVGGGEVRQVELQHPDGALEQVVFRSKENEGQDDVYDGFVRKVADTQRVLAHF